jgi:predicted dehydrogenase
VLALCDIDPKRLHGASQQFSTPRATVSFGELLAMPDLDIIDICTPPALHLEQSLAALTAGKQVICEKPLVGSLADADRLIATELSATSSATCARPSPSRPTMARPGPSRSAKGSNSTTAIR